MRGTMPSLPRTRKRTSRKAAESLRLMPVNSAWIASPFEIAGDPFFIAEVLEQQRRVRKYSLLVATSTKHFIKQHVGAYSARCSIFNITITQRINVDNNYIPMVNKIHLAPLRQQKLVEEYNLLLSSASLSSLVSSSVELQRQFLALRRAGALPLQACLERRGLGSCALPTHREFPFVYKWGVLRTPLFYQIKSLCNCTSAAPKPLVPHLKRSTVISPALSN